MRKIVALAALISFMPVANAADKAEMAANAEYRIRYQMDQSYTGDEAVDTTMHTAKHRFKLDLGFRSGEKFGAHLSMLHNAQFGNFGDVTTDPINGGDNQQKDAFNADNSALVNQAYGTWMVNDAWYLKFGRGGFTLADGSVISQNDWEATPYSFDGILANYEHEMVRLNLFGVKAIDNAAANTTTNNNDPEVNFFGFAVDIKNLPEFLKVANIHWMKINGNELDSPAPIAPNRDEMRYGLALSGDTAGVDYRFDLAMTSGETTSAGTASDVDGMMYHLEVGYSMPEMMKSRVYVGYHVDTGDDGTSADSNEGYDTFFYERHCNSGCMDVLAWGNLSFIKAGYTFSPMDQVDVGIHYWMFERESDTAAATFGNNGAYVDNSGTVTDTDLGSEIDLVVTKKYDNGFAINALVGMFDPGSYLKDEATAGGTNTVSDKYTQVFLEGKMTF